MTVAFDPRVDWVREDIHAEATSPVLGPMVDGDLCDIRVFRSGRRVYCGQTAVHAATDVNGGTRILCAAHTALYFPNAR